MAAVVVRYRYMARLGRGEGEGEDGVVTLVLALAVAGQLATRTWGYHLGGTTRCVGSALAVRWQFPSSNPPKLRSEETHQRLDVSCLKGVQRRGRTESSQDERQRLFTFLRILESNEWGASRRWQHGKFGLGFGFK